MPTSDLPDDLIDRLARAIDPAGWATLGEGAQAAYRLSAQRVLTALAEWADGALIDPDGWRRLDATHPGGIAYCIVHDEPAIEGHDPMGDCRPDTYGCIERNLHVLTPRET